MIPQIQPVLYLDPQAQVPQQRCRNCGQVCFGRLCLRCRREMP